MCDDDAGYTGNNPEGDDDHDGIENRKDPDSDGDGVPNNQDLQSGMRSTVGEQVSVINGVTVYQMEDWTGNPIWVDINRNEVVRSRENGDLEFADGRTYTRTEGGPGFETMRGTDGSMLTEAIDTMGLPNIHISGGDLTEETSEASSAPILTEEDSQPSLDNFDPFGADTSVDPTSFISSVVDKINNRRQGTQLPSMTESEVEEWLKKIVKGMSVFVTGFVFFVSAFFLAAIFKSSHASGGIVLIVELIFLIGVIVTGVALTASKVATGIFKKLVVSGMIGFGIGFLFVFASLLK